MKLKLYQKDFIQTAIETDALKFGRFELKSGRISPYFFNAGAFHYGKALEAMGRAYAEVLFNLRKDYRYDVLFGPAYKGIPLVSAACIALYKHHGLSLPWAFNRKEVKDHGEGGIIVGADLHHKRVLIIDDVITAGTAIRESIEIIEKHGGQPVAAVVALNRMEKSDNEKSTLSQLQNNHPLPIFHIINLDDLLAFVSTHEGFIAYQPAMQAYRRRYGIALK